MFGTSILQPEVEITLIVPNGRDIAELKRTLAPLQPDENVKARLVVARHTPRRLDLCRTRELGISLDIAVQVVYSDRKEPPFLRNAALSAVKSGYVLFLDDDVIPSPLLLSYAANLVSEAPETIHQGPPYLTANPKSIIARLEGSLYERAFSSYVDRSGRVSLLDARILLAPRAVFDYLLFDNALVWGGEGKELAERMIAAGLDLRIAPTLRVSHLNRDTLRSLLEQKRTHGYGRGAMLRRDGPGQGGWKVYAWRYFRRHFTEPLLQAAAGDLPVADALYSVTINFIFWIFVLINYVFSLDRRQ